MSIRHFTYKICHLLIINSARIFWCGISVIMQYRVLGDNQFRNASYPRCPHSSIRALGFGMRYLLWFAWHIWPFWITRISTYEYITSIICWMWQLSDKIVLIWITSNHETSISTVGEVIPEPPYSRMPLCARLLVGDGRKVCWTSSAPVIQCEGKCYAILQIMNCGSIQWFDLLSKC